MGKQNISKYRQINPRVDWNNSLTIDGQLRIPLSIIESVIGKALDKIT